MPLLVGGVLGLAIIVGAGVWLQFGRVDTDKTTGCPKEGPASITAVVLDVTDNLGVIQQADLKAFMDEVRDQIPKYGRLDLYTVGTVEKHPLDVQFRACNPGSGKDVASPLTGNAVLADRAWRKRFADRLQDVLNRIVAGSPDAASPIIESVQSVSVTSFEDVGSRKAADTRLILVSDLLQHTKRASFYKGAPDFAQFKSTQYYREVRTEMHGATVTVSIIPRETKRNVQDRRLMQFWIDYFSDQGAIVDRWRPIKGGGT
jgi:hypothetical protein